MIKKTYDIAIKIGRDDIITAPAIVVQNDYDVYTLNIKVFDGNTEIDYEELDAATITFALANDAVVQSDPDRLTLSSTGISYDMGTDEISCPGQVIASVQLFGTDNERLTTARFKFTVQQDLITPGAVQSDSRFPLLQQLLDEVQQLKQDIVELQIPDNSIMDTKLSDAAGQIKARLAELLDDFTSLSGQFDAHVADMATELDKKVDIVTEGTVYCGIDSLNSGKINPERASAKYVDVTTALTLSLAHAGCVIRCVGSTAFSITIPPDSVVAFPSGTEIEIFRDGAGDFTIVPGAGVTMFSGTSGTNFVATSRKIANRVSSVCLKKYNSNIWFLQGDLG